MRSDEDWLSTVMPRSRHRACPQGGLKLDLNRLARKGYIKFGANIGAKGIVWSNSLLERNRERHHHRRHDRSRPFLFRIGDWQLRTADNFGLSPAPLRWSSVVLPLPSHPPLATILWTCLAPGGSAAGNPGAGKLLTDRNCWIVTTARKLGSPLQP